LRAPATAGWLKKLTNYGESPLGSKFAQIIGCKAVHGLLTPGYGAGAVA
jgi:hypothetical protein